jgi:signal peptidase I
MCLFKEAFSYIIINMKYLFIFLFKKSKVSVTTYCKKKCLLFPLLFVLLFLLAICLRVFIFDIFTIASSSMESCILKGDKIIVSKISIGPRLPSSLREIPWLNLSYLLGQHVIKEGDSVWCNYKRLRGFSVPQRGNIIVFESPIEEGELIVKRCMGLPGDTLLIRNEIILTNHKEIDELTVKKIFDNFDSVIVTNNCNSSGFQVIQKQTMGKSNFSTLQIENQIQQESLSVKYSNIYKERTFPNNDAFKWNENNFGPLLIPAKGIKIVLNEFNFILYGKLINKFENVVPSENSGSYFLNGISVKSYTFKYDYYFMIGDNRHQSIDSRYFGFVPEMNIIGKAVFVLYSKSVEGFIWNRLLKEIG